MVDYPAFSEALTLAAVWEWAAQELEPLADARQEARWLITAILELPLSAWLRDSLGQPLNDAQRQAVHSAILRRKQGEPLSRIMGKREFWSLPFIVTPSVLDPRADSETVIEAVVQAFPNRTTPHRILDLGTGSGCLLLSLLKEYPHSTGIGVDYSLPALRTARQNSEVLGCDGRAFWINGNWTESLHTTFTIIVSNPPYIPTATITHLAPEVRLHDPLSALDGGTDGFDCYRELIPQLPRLLGARGQVFLEIGQGQETAVTALLQTAKFGNIASHCDLQGIIRCISGGKT